MLFRSIVDSEIQDELTEAVLESKFMGQIHTLDLSCGTLSDKGGKLLLEKLPQYGNIKKLDVHYHFMTEKMEKQLRELSLEVDASDRNKPSSYRGETYMYAMLTE